MVWFTIWIENAAARGLQDVRVSVAGTAGGQHDKQRTKGRSRLAWNTKTRQWR